MNDRGVVIVSAVRSPIGSFRGSLASLKASELGSIVVKESLTRAGLNGADVSEVIMGQILTAMEGQNPARQAAINAGIPVDVPAYQLNMLCGSGLNKLGSTSRMRNNVITHCVIRRRSVVTGYCSIKSGESDVIVAGGQESMSRAPHAVCLREGIKFGNCNLVDTLMEDGLMDAFYDIHMAITAENIAEKYAISREAQDAYASKSQQKAEAAIVAGHFDKEIVPVIIAEKKEPVVVSKDEFPKFGTTAEKLAKLRPAFRPKNGTVTAGNASGVNDGAAAVVLMSQEAAERKGIPSLANIVAVAQVGVEPQFMGLGPIGAIKLVLKKANWTKEEVDFYELNEAFAAQAIACVQELGLDPEKVNVNGGAIALGHPVGSSGTRILVTLLHTLERTGKRKGVASLCIGGGMGIAVAVERK
ncbi:acetyl-CoA acetyltransferase isoform X3 [Ooceraea biroi]|uniref:acetyl-CoA acetyltransferase isoform X3 n=1 Tax=Ooceraea biroi TaxID=2015173 RepID=UPI000F08B4AA|nr:acetyl-CoA acetyltransferase isoform X3 [Ooceraea biroi]